ncbi:MAG: hypothetical protein U0V74_17025 [Chitinophagales bacterium]
MSARIKITPIKGAVALLLLLSVAAVFSCRQIREVSKNQFKLQPPIPALDPEFSEFSLNAEQGGEFSLPSGTKIIVPANVMVHKDGTPVTGSVNLTYREFHDAPDAFMAGIPLTYTDDKGQHRMMQTAGMFEIRANQNGEELAIADGKNVTVNLASGNNDKDFSEFTFNENTGTWTQTEPSEVTANADKQALQNTVSKLEEQGKKLDKKNYFVLNYTALLDVYYGDSVWYMDPHNKFLKTKVQRYGIQAGNYESRSLSEYVTYKGVTEPAEMLVWNNLSGKKLPKFQEYVSAKFTALKGGEFLMEVMNPKGKKVFQGKVKPEIPLAKLFKISPEKWNKDYEQVMKQVDSVYTQLASMEDFTRSVVVGNFGIHNCDRFLTDEKRMDVVATIQLDNEQQADVKERMKLYYMSSDNKNLASWDWEDGKRTMVITDDPNACLFTLLPNGKAAVFSKEDFKKLNFAELKKPGKNEVVFRLKTMKKAITSADEIRKLINS